MRNTSTYIRLQAVYALVFLFLIFNSAISQINFIRCDNEAYHQQLTEQYSEYLRSFDSLNIVISNQDNYNKSFDEIVVPVVVHIVFKNQAENLPLTRILSQIDVLNEDFNRENSNFINTPIEFQNIGGNAKIRFCLTNIDPNGNFTTGITFTQTSVPQFSRELDNIKFTNQGGRDAWDTRRYLNIWVGDIGTSVLGYAPLVGNLPPERDGVVINFRAFGRFFSLTNPFNQGRTCTHEIGHFFNLIHTWGNVGGCFNDDWVGDTPTQYTFYEGCPQAPQNSCGSNDAFMNFMDYPHDACLTFFTQGQVQRMRNTIATSRQNLVNWYTCPLTSLEETQSNSSKILIYPNPTTDFLHINWIDETPSEIQIFDTFGRMIFQEKIYHMGDVYTLNISHLPNGSYIINVVSKETKYSKWFIKSEM